MATQETKTQKQTINWSVVLTLIALGLLFLWSETNLLANTYKLRVNGVPAKATVVNVLQIKLISRSTIEFTTVIYNQKVNTLLPVGPYLQKGDVVDILYSPSTPQVAMLTNYPVFHGAGIVALLSFIFVFLETKYRFISSSESQDEEMDFD